MAETPDKAYSPTDDELDALVQEVMGEDVSQAPDPVDDAAQPLESDEPEQPTAESEVETAEAEVEAETEEGAPVEAAETGDEPAAPKPDSGNAAGSRPFTFKGAGKDHTFPGITELKDGSARVTKEGAAALRQTLASYVGIQQNWKDERRTLQRKLRDAEQGKSDREIEAEQITTLFKDLRGMTPEERWAWASKFDEDAPKLELEIEKQKLERDRKALERQQQGGDLLPEEQEEQVRSTLQQELAVTFRRLMATPEAKHLSDQDKRALWEKWAAKPQKLVGRYTDDDPATGAKKGDLYFDDSDVVDDFNDRVAVRSQTKGTLSAADRNRSMNADRNRTNQIPPAPRARAPQPSSDANRGKPKKKDRRAFEKSFMRGELDAKED